MKGKWKVKWKAIKMEVPELAKKFIPTRKKAEADFLEIAKKKRKRN